MHRITRKMKRWMLFGICVIIMVCLCACHKEDDGEKLELEQVQAETTSGQKNKEKAPAAELNDADPDSEVKLTELYVHVCGQVQSPGVYKLKNGSRVFEAIDAAGGLLEQAAAEALNQAEMVQDGQQIYIPAIGEQLSREEDSAVGSNLPQGSTGPSDDGKVNINTASKEELMTLNGIGETRADSIVKYREEHGSFSSVEELKEIAGIKEGIFSKLKDQVKAD